MPLPVPPPGSTALSVVQLSPSFLASLPARVLNDGNSSPTANIAQCGLLPNGSTVKGYINIFSGAMPVTPTLVTLPAGSLIEFSTTNNDFLIQSSVNPAVISTSYVSAQASGLATWFLWSTRDNSGTIYQQAIGTVGLQGSGADLELLNLKTVLANTQITAGEFYRVLNLRMEFYGLYAHPLVANFTSDITTGTVPLSVNFTDTSTGDPRTWAWDFENNGSTDSTLQNPTFVYTTPGTYSVKLTVTGLPPSNTIVKTNYITANPPIFDRYFRTFFANAFTTSADYGAVSFDGLTYISIGMTPPAPVAIGTFQDTPSGTFDVWSPNTGFTLVGGGNYYAQPSITFANTDNTPLAPGHTTIQTYGNPGSPNLVQMTPWIPGKAGDTIYLRANQFGSSGSTVGGKGLTFEFIISIGPDQNTGELYRFTSNLTYTEPAPNFLAEALPLSSYPLYGVTYRGP